SRERSADRKPGGQPGRKGSGLAPTVTPDRTETLPAPGDCSGCGADLADAVDAGVSWAQVWDLPPIALEKVHYLLPRRRCGCCGKITTAAPSFGAAGNVTYGPNVNAAAILLASEGNVPLERTAHLMAALLGAPVSTGFVARALERLAQRLGAAGFDEAMKAALRAEEVLCGDETPTNVIRRDTDEHGQPVPGSPHAVTVRTPDPRLVWYAPIRSRSKSAIAGLGVVEGYAGYLVRDDYAGWHQFDAQLAGVQQCAAHLIRHAKGVLELHPTQQQWAGQVITVLREAATAVTEASTNERDHLDPQLLTDLRQRYDQAVRWGITTNRHRDWPKGNHPGYNLAKRLHDKADQVWTFTRNLTVPWTNNASEQALKGPKRHQAVSGYWHTLTTLAQYCRVRSYLVSARNNGIRAIDAIHTALNGKPWLPTTHNSLTPQLNP
ncbi:MAG: IS66 family transposase, partial [Actinobacteria bacterium]|nr:IS66 family transposase [Actinomycetota bacterium]